MAIQKRFIHFKKFSDFNSKKLSANEANTQYTVGVSGAIQDGEPDILYQSYVWIKDTKQQWTHGQLYNGNDSVYITEFAITDLFSVMDNNSSLVINKDDLVNAVRAKKLIAIPYENAQGYQIASVDAFDEEIYFNLHFFDNSISFVIYPNTSNNEITVDDIFTVFLQEALTSGENIRTINGEDIIGDGSDLELATKDELNAKADDSSVVHTTGDEIIYGTKEFTHTVNANNGILFRNGGSINSYSEANGTTENVIGYIRQTCIVNNQNYPLYLYGSIARPKYNNFEDIAFLSDVNGKQDALISGTNIKTINGESILGSGDITISGGGSSGGSSAYSEVNHGTSDTTFALTPNTFHVWDEVASLTLTLGSETAGVANEYLFQFTSGATATRLSLPSDLKWTEELVIERNKIYQVSILKGMASVLEFNNAIVFPVIGSTNNLDNEEYAKVYEYFVNTYNLTSTSDSPSNGVVITETLICSDVYYGGHVLKVSLNGTRLLLWTQKALDNITVPSITNLGRYQNHIWD